MAPDNLDGLSDSGGPTQRDGDARPGEGSGAPPGVELGALRTLDPRFLTAERVSGLILCALVAGGGLIALTMDLALGWWDGSARAAAWAALGLLTPALGWGALGWPPIAIRAVRYRYGPGGIEIRRGVWWRRTIMIPAARIQHTDVTQGPLLRRFGLATLTVHTAATKATSVSLPGLAHGDALRVRDALTRASGGEGV